MKNKPPVIIGGATTRTMRVHWAARELKLDYESQLIGSRTGETQTNEFLALNPKSKIPVLVDGDNILTESSAIIYYLDSLATNDTFGLVPEDPQQHVRYQEWQSFILMELDAQSLYIMRKHRDLEHIYGSAPAAIETAIEGFNFQVNTVARALDTNAYLLGETFTGVDILLTTCLDWAKAYDFDLQPVLTSYLNRIHERAAYRSAHAHNFSISAGA